jgi:hypothetical protein
MPVGKSPTDTDGERAGVEVATNGSGHRSRAPVGVIWLVSVGMAVSAACGSGAQRQLVGLDRGDRV